MKVHGRDIAVASAHGKYTQLCFKVRQGTSTGERNYKSGSYLRTPPGQGLPTAFSEDELKQTCSIQHPDPEECSCGNAEAQGHSVVTVSWCCGVPF